MKKVTINEQRLIEEEPCEWTIQQSGDMRVPVKLYTNKAILENIKGDDSVRQACNVATLPGIKVASIVMPDMHQGYGFSIGGVAAFDMQEGVISPGGIGFDINCGVRLLATNLTVEEVKPKVNELLERFYARCPVGVGSESRIRIDDDEYDELLRDGARWAVKKGYGTDDDVRHCESNGRLPGADPDKVSPRAKARGRKQLGTVGAGNHFIEVQVVDQVYDENAATAYGVTGKGQVVVMIHCGSRGFGHQVCTDYIRRMEDEQPVLASKLVDKNLIYAPLDSTLAKEYYAAMAAAANYAFTNRHVLGHWVRESFTDVFGAEAGAGIKTVYDICHNIAKEETHEINGKATRVMVHRKGATRAFPPGFTELPEEYQPIGQPVLIPGSMGTHSYLLHGTEKAMQETFGSCAHGAGRLMSRFKANKEFTPEGVRETLAEHDVVLKAASRKGVTEEAPGAYKDVDQVITVCHEAGLALKVARMKPLGVIKG